MKIVELLDEEGCPLVGMNGEPFTSRQAIVACLLDAGHGEHSAFKKLADGESFRNEEIVFLRELTSAFFRPAVARQLYAAVERA